MNDIKEKQMSDSFLLGILLAMVGGFLDIYTYLLRGEVFATAQTGNIVLLGLNITQGNIKKALYYLIPISTFAIGIIVADFIKKKHNEYDKIHWRQISILIEFIILLLIGFMPVGKLNMLVNILISFVCSIQVESFRKMEGSPYATTMCTGNLRSGSEQLFKYITTKDLKARNRCLKYFSIILFFIIGVIGGTMGSLYLGVRSIWICCFILAIVFFIMLKKETYIN